MNDRRAWDEKFAASNTEQQAVMLCAQMWAEKMEMYLDVYPNMDPFAFESMAHLELNSFWPAPNDLEQDRILLRLCELLLFGWEHLTHAGLLRESLEFKLRDTVTPR
jgi:hypothetical protein